MVQRLPVPGGDSGAWGNILNSYLQASHASDGTLLPQAVADAGAILTLNGQTPTDGTLTITPTDVGALAAVEGVNLVASSGASVTIPAVTVATLNDITLTAGCSLTFPAATAGSSFTLVLRQGGAGSYTVAWPTVKWPGGVVPTLSTTVGNIDVFTFLCANGQWLGFVSGLAMA